MLENEFKVQIERLESQWRNTYGEERKALLWQVFRDVAADDFKAAVDDCLLKSRCAPLLNELEKAINEARNRRLSNRSIYGLEPVGFSSILSSAARNNKIAHPDFVKACVKLWNSRFSFASQKKPLTPEEYFEGCNYLDNVADRYAKEDKVKPFLRGSESADKRSKNWESENE